ncbi:MAG: protein translocase subunit SecF, partial [Armatimonadota bacterium]|nr:protein translocase subunit SecF [Armatimonadota bacterium]
MSTRPWDIIGARRWGYLLSVALIVPGVAALVINVAAGRGALNWGIDFTGGDFFQFVIERPFEVADVRAVVDRHATGESIIQKAGQEAIIRTRPLDDDAKRALLADLRQTFGRLTVLREEEVGPKIGRELRNIAIVAVVLGLALQVLYISYRFKSVRYALTADMALLHDLLLVVGVFALTRKEVNSTFVAVLLTVVGYSINDTIIVYDRIRENLAQRPREPFDRLVNRSILEVLARSITTGLTTVMAIGAVYVFGGVTVRDFAFGLMIGILTGGYSSVFNASALLVDWHLWTDRRTGRREEAPARPLARTADAEPAAVPA